MSSTVTLRSAYAFGHRAGWLEEHEDGWFVVRDLKGHIVGTCSSEARAMHALDQHLLRKLYPPREAIGQ